MPKFDGYLFSRLTAIGSKSEGPLYFLQQFDYEEYQVIKKAPLWKNDPKLHKYLNRKVSITGDMSFSGIDYKSIALYKPGGKLAAANTLQIDLKLQHNPLWIDKQPGPKKGMRSTTFTLLVKWPYRSIWEGQCPTTQLYDFFVEYKGKKVYFCCKGCEEKFLADPEQYVAKLPQFKQ